MTKYSVEIVFITEDIAAVIRGLVRVQVPETGYDASDRTHSNPLIK